MIRVRRLVCAMVLGGVVCSAQLTMDQKISDFQYIASVYDKRYGPYEWKRDTFGVDLLDISPWLDKVRAAKTDLEFYDVAVRYVASLNDAHDSYYVPSNFVASLPFSVDVYDGKLLVDSHSGSIYQLPISNGYELVSIDGVDAQKILDGLLVYNVAANARSTRRLAASYLTVRPQGSIPSAPNVPDTSTVVFRRPDGKSETYQIPWTKSGLPLTSVGTFPTPRATPAAPSVSQFRRPRPDRGSQSDTLPDPLPVFARLRNWRIPENKTVRGFGAVAPVFASSLPAGFVRRLGGSSADFFYSGTFSSKGLNIGYIRIPDFVPASQTAALSSFVREVTFFQQNTDGLIVDVMRNPGGDGAYTNALLSYLIPTQWRAIGFEVRATSDWVAAISSSLESAKAQGAPRNIIDGLQRIKNAIVEANEQLRGRTIPIPLDDVSLTREPLTDARGNLVAYTKPLIVLTDEMSASAAEVLAATVQDNERGLLFGWRTMGAGGNVEVWESGSYSFGLYGGIYVTESLMNRKNPVITKDYPAAPYVENIGVRPDVENDYMTAGNLSNNGKPFVDAMVEAAVSYIQKKK